MIAAMTPRRAVLMVRVAACLIVVLLASAGHAAATRHVSSAHTRKSQAPPVSPGHTLSKRSPALPASADTTASPSFAGRWKLSMTRSTFGTAPGGKPASRTDAIEQSGTRIKQTLYLVLGSKPDTTVYLYSTDGTPTVNKVAGRDIRSVVAWEGRALHLVSTAKLLVVETSLDERWTLAAGGRELTYRRHVKYGFGESDQTLIFERE